MTITDVKCTLVDPNQGSVYEGQEVLLRAKVRGREDSEHGDHELNEKELADHHYDFTWEAHLGRYGAPVVKDAKAPWKATLMTDNVQLGTYTVRVTVTGEGIPKSPQDREHPIGRHEVFVKVNPQPASSGGSQTVVLGRTLSAETEDAALSPIIRGSTEALSFQNYREFIDAVMCEGANSPNLSAQEKLGITHLNARRGTPFPGVDAYQLLKVATEVYVMLNCGVLEKIRFSPEALASYNRRHDRGASQSSLNSLWLSYLEAVNGLRPDQQQPYNFKTLPYLAAIRSRLGGRLIQQNPQDEFDVRACDGIFAKKLAQPCFFELIWSYWHEEGMLVQTMNAIAVRFQNQRTSGRDPLAQFDIDPLRPLSNLLWGYIQDEQHRLSVPRRAYEYDHHYGITLEGKAVPPLRSADSRSKFLEGFHNLLHAALLFYQQDDDTTVKSDGFSVLNSLKEVHLLLTEGMHNQFGDLPSTARMEMLMQQWILARPEMREFLGGRIMVPYTEDWMDRVDAMKKLQGWTDVTVTYFNELARFGEQLLLSIRYGQWNGAVDPDSGANWAREWRAEVKQYVHAYRTVTGIDISPDQTDLRLSADRYAPPSVHLRKRLEAQRQQPAQLTGFGSPRRASAALADRSAKAGGPKRQQPGTFIVQEIE